MAGAIDSSCGIEETSSVPRVSKLLDLQSLSCPPLVLQLPDLMLDYSLRFSMGCSFCLAVDVILPGDEGLPLDVNETLDFGVILIEPVLMFTGLIAEGACTGVDGNRLQQVPVCLNIIWILVGQIRAELGLELLLKGCLTQPFDVELWPALSSLHPSFPHKTDGHDGADETVVCPAVICTGHGSGVEYIMAVFGADDCVIDEVPALGARMHPGCFKLVLLTEECVGDDQVVLCTL